MFPPLFLFALSTVSMNVRSSLSIASVHVSTTSVLHAERHTNTYTDGHRQSEDEDDDDNEEEGEGK